MAPYRPLFLEEPSWRENPAGLGEIAAKSPVPIATGEGLFSRYEFKQLLDVKGAAGRIEGMGLRLYNPETRRWSINWASSFDGVLQPPMSGKFKNGRGEFYDHETFDGKAIFDCNSFFDITPDFSRFEQAFSDDGGKTWETNWIMTFTRTKDGAD